MASSDPPSFAALSTQERQLCEYFRDLPKKSKYKYTQESALELCKMLFWSLAGKDEHLPLLFPKGMPADMKLRGAQGAEEGAEYSEAARGKRCGHILKSGEASYMCRTCSIDDTCCLCSRCYHATDHTGHQVRINISSGNTGCCDCGDEEAWKVPLICTIHSHVHGNDSVDKGKGVDALPNDLKTSMRMTIGRVLDYICDVISCSPEQLRMAKTKESILTDETQATLFSNYYGDERPEDERQYCLVIWNDEKHTLRDVQEQIARACKKRQIEAHAHARETDSIGRSILATSSDIDALLRMAKKLEEIRVTVTIRAARDTFREQMCATMVEWLLDISGCSVGKDHHILLNTVCEEFLKPWREGSSASYKLAGLSGIDDEADIEDQIERSQHLSHSLLHAFQQRFAGATAPTLDDEDLDSDGLEIIELAVDDHDNALTDDEDDEDDIMQEIDEDEDDDAVDWVSNVQTVADTEDVVAAGFPPPPPVPPIDPHNNIAAGSSTEATEAGASNAPLPATVAQIPTIVASSVSLTSDSVPPARVRPRDLTPSEADIVEPLIAPNAYPKAEIIPKTPNRKKSEKPKPGRYWTEYPEMYRNRSTEESRADDVFQRVRLDHLILFDLRMWKKVRNDLRALYISTMVTIPKFKHILGRRFAALYTTLAQLYLIGDREPDHSIISLSLQMFTTPSITAELVERANFLTNLFAILYTFLTTRQVSHPWEVSSTATLAFDSGSVTNRRMYHFYMDLKHLFSSLHVQHCLRTEPRYLMQFLDLVKLHQGIGPNTRAVGEHVEYETDSWITASLVTREINRMARQFSEAFRNLAPEDMGSLKNAIRTTAKTLILHCVGAERFRFKNAEIKREVRFKGVGKYEFDIAMEETSVVDFVVEQEPISFHHALHYTLSWLIECGRSMSNEELRNLLSFTTEDLMLQPRSMGHKTMTHSNLTPEDYLINTFDFPLRVCAWLSQIKTNMWVRNGISLRHQAATYRGVSMRDVCYQRDLFMLQTAAVTCNPSRVLASIVDRFGQEKWLAGLFHQNCESQDDNQHLDVVEDMIHLLISILSDRSALIPIEEEPDPILVSMRRDLIHVLCLKPLSFSEISSKVPDRYSEHPNFHSVLEELSTFEFREGISDVGTFKLRPELAEEIDIFNSHFTRNQREESEAVYRKAMAQRTGKKLEEIVYEPKLRPIHSGAFKDLAALTSTGMFAQIVFFCLLYPLNIATAKSTVQPSRVEVYLNSVLHLVLIAIAEDKIDETNCDNEECTSFIEIALTQESITIATDEKNTIRAATIVGLLRLLLLKSEYSGCHGKIELILSKIALQRPSLNKEAHDKLGIAIDSTPEAAEDTALSAEEERERKKKAAISRQARVMAQFQKQQQEFMGKQGEIDWGSDIGDSMDEDEADAKADGTHQVTWKFPSGTCLQCQEKTDERKTFGTFAMFNESRIVRLTDIQIPAVVREVRNTPESLDQQMPRDRPFGMSGENIVKITKYDKDGQPLESEEQGISQGFSSKFTLPGPVSVSCGHLMHFSCFETYYEATQRRHAHQIARHHPESLKRFEFVCPLCKALANTFVPIVWKPKEEVYPGVLQPETKMSAFLNKQMLNPLYTNSQPELKVSTIFSNYASTSLIGPLAGSAAEARSGTSQWQPVSITAVSGIPGVIGLDLAAQIPQPSNIRESSFPSTNNPMTDLVRIYSRMSNSLRTQDFLPCDMGSDSRQLCFNDTLVRSVAFSIASVEIQQRGVGVVAEPNTAASFVSPGIFVDRIPEISMTYLKILSDTARTYILVGELRSGTDNFIEAQFQRDACTQLKQLFICDYSDLEDVNNIPPVLAIDGFVLLTDFAYCMSEVHQFEIAHLVRLCYLAEVVRVVHRISNNIPAPSWSQRLFALPENTPSNIRTFAQFCQRLMEMTFDAKAPIETTSEPESSLENLGFEQAGLSDLAGIYEFVKKYALVFLRKTAILMHARFGVSFSAYTPSNPTDDELTRLTEALCLPSFDDIIASILPNATSLGWPDGLDHLVFGWIRHDLMYPTKSDTKSHKVTANKLGVVEKSRAFVPMGLAHPAIFELIGLPKTFDTLIEEATRHKCPTTGKDIQDATICLLCGEIFCGQSTCCLQEANFELEGKISVGGTQQHMWKCQGITGVFLNIRKCCTFYLFRRSGSFAHAPYIDRYGETDMGLRHGRQLNLSQKRYDILRMAYLSNGIPSFISRRLESDVNNGGWESI
ncbi:E3 ubiquitin-protein ligase ubr1 [Ceratocystis fimbriata CBS 114723]|uniref:E3 ubiquitin-protein ligase n=1 Tax=Ceratocystis fimbriata CBS 114723 TaxID=1035309 RepID=A0A2C5XJA5_9PEZI|nr:E3 ubiquitin-protein ligase ubr1 [Ceratocystis fimbriata CBS 114723]